MPGPWRELDLTISKQSVTFFSCLFWQFILTEWKRWEKMNLNISFAGDNQLQDLTPLLLQKKTAEEPQCCDTLHMCCSHGSNWSSSSAHRRNNSTAFSGDTAKLLKKHLYWSHSLLSSPRHGNTDVTRDCTMLTWVVHFSKVHVSVKKSKAAKQM